MSNKQNDPVSGAYMRMLNTATSHQIFIVFILLFS